jgi:DNA-binding NarL/FixJ family response regulator
MTHSDEYIRRAIRALEAERAAAIRQLQVVDVKIAQLNQVLRHEAAAPVVPREPGEPAKRGEAEREILEMLRQGRPLTAGEIATRRGTSANAASNVLRRLYKRNQITNLGRGRYALNLAPEGAQSSLAVDAAGEEQVGEGGGS